MSAIVNVISKVVSAAVDIFNTVVDVLVSVGQWAWSEILSPALEFVVGLFGIKDEDIISTNISVQRILKDDTVMSAMMTKIMLEKMKEDSDLGVIDRLLAESKVTRARYNAYYKYGKNDYVYGLPEGNLKAIVIDNAKVKDVIDRIYGINCTVIDSKISAPDKYEWTYFYFQENYGYKVYSNEMLYNGYVYKISNIDYNYDLDRYDVFIRTYEDQTTTVSDVTTVTITSNYEVETTDVVTTTTVTVTSYDATRDNKNTLVTERTIVSGSVTGAISDTTVTVSNVDELVAKGSVSNSTTSSTTTSTKDIDLVTTSVDRHTVKTGSVQGFISETVVNQSLTTQRVTSGTVSGSVSTVVISTTTVIGVVWNSNMIPIPAFEPTRYYITRYYTTVSGQWKYWLYEESSGLYPELDDQNFRITELEMLPIVPIRNATVNVNDDKSSDLYKQSKEILNYIGIDIDTVTDALKTNADIANVEDAFIHFGLNPNDSDATVSEMLYRMFEYSFNDTSLLNNSGNSKGYTATVQEGPFNAAVAWSNQSIVISTGVIGPLNSYKHSVNGQTLVLQKQEEPNRYVTITMYDVSAITFIDRQGLVGTVATKLQDDNFYIPLSIYFVKQLSPIEQMKLFNKSLILTVYAAQVQHLEWYQTEAFGTLMQIIGIVVFLFTWNPTVLTWQTVLYAVGNYLIAMYVINELMKVIDNPALRIIAAVAAAYVMAGGFDLNNMSFVGPSVLTSSVTTFCQFITTAANAYSVGIAYDLDELKSERIGWEAQADAAYKRLDAEEKKLEDYLSTEYVAALSNVDPVSQYLYGVDAMMYRAINIQYDYNKIFDYNVLVSDFYTNKLTLGII